jgi:hypothetical protein
LEKELLTILLALIIAVVLGGLVAFWYNMRLFFYLQKHHYSKWCDLTTIGTMGPGASNPFRWIPYLYCDSEGDDPPIHELKRRIRLVLKIEFALLAAIGVNVILILFL